MTTPAENSQPDPGSGEPVEKNALGANDEKTPTTADGAPAADGAAEEADGGLDKSVVTALKTVFDPEIPVDIYELGLVYDIQAKDDGHVDVKFTLTSPNCPAAQSIPEEMERKIKALAGVTDVKLDLTWDPPWTPDMMSDAAKLKMNMF